MFILRTVPRARSAIDLSAVADAFSADGLHGTSADEIAARAGIAKPTLYAYGRSKSALLLAAVEAEVERVVDRLHHSDVRTRNLAPQARVTALARALLDHAAARPAGFRLLAHTARHANSDVAASVDAALDRVPARITAALRRDIGDASGAPTLALALYGATVAIATAGPVTPERRGELATALGRAMLTALPAEVLAESAGARGAAPDQGIY
jgi:AcrR family transcriptional regulator